MESYEKLTEHIDERFKITYGTVEASNARDDPMGIFALMEPEAEDKPSDGAHAPESPDYQHLDAVSKGKGKGKGDGTKGGGAGWGQRQQQPEGSCRVCWQMGHYARDCPWRTPEQL